MTSNRLLLQIQLIPDMNIHFFLNGNQSDFPVLGHKGLSKLIIFTDFFTYLVEFALMIRLMFNVLGILFETSLNRL